MNRYELEHMIRAAAGNADCEDIVIIGSQAILGTYPNAPAELLRSMEADVYPLHRPEDSILIDGAIGERSIFHDTFGYYAHGVGEDTAILPEGWRARLVQVGLQRKHPPLFWLVSGGGRSGRGQALGWAGKGCRIPRSPAAAPVGRA